ncbi:Protein FAM161A [Collichthys lucidus]|uniref:Protein FAM161A n=1 Tax=Collichthys lucidus TaxID=240159 RepID=A0A4U5VD64_COLLU|nr:Protein FAM161A [Collichthys lucidus]
MAAMYRSAALEQKEIMSLYGRGRQHYFVGDEDCHSEEYDLDSACGDEGDRSVRRLSLSAEIYGLQRQQRVYFSNQEYYRRLEELKSAHLRNMAELERLYISHGREWHGEEDGDGGGLERGDDTEARLSVSSGPARKLQRINSQEELDFHETSSGSDQSELYRADSMGELELDNPRGTAQDRTFVREILLSPKEMTEKQFLFQPEASDSKLHGRRQTRQTGVGANSKVTVPKPFQMMLREEERKRHKVRTRSEIELENTLLRRELEELQECQKKFRASPAPAHIHLPLYEIISRRSGQRSRSSSTKRNQTSAAASPQPFLFLERERRKREAKMVEEFGKLRPKGERQDFKARPMPSSVYGTRDRADTKTTSCQPEFLTVCTLERETRVIQTPKWSRMCSKPSQTRRSRKGQVHPGEKQQRRPAMRTDRAYPAEQRGEQWDASTAPRVPLLRRLCNPKTSLTDKLRLERYSRLQLSPPSAELHPYFLAACLSLAANWLSGHLWRKRAESSQGHVLANHNGQMDELVEMNTNYSLRTTECFPVVRYEQNCLSEVLNRQQSARVGPKTGDVGGDGDWIFE